MTFSCCKDCIIDMICTDPCEKFEIEKLQVKDLSNFNKCLRLMKKYQNKKFRNGNVSIEITSSLISIYKNNVFHRDDGPAVIYRSGSKAWYKNGKLHHRVDGPTIIYSNGGKAWYKNGELHRDDGPAVIYSDGTKEWYKNGERHRDDGPAIIYSNGSKEWYKNGERHREDGPAVIYSDGSKVWYKNGVRIK